MPTKFFLLLCTTAALLVVICAPSSAYQQNVKEASLGSDKILVESAPRQQQQRQVEREDDVTGGKATLEEGRRQSRQLWHSYHNVYNNLIRAFGGRKKRQISSNFPFDFPSIRHLMG